MEQWDHFSKLHSHDPFWAENQPAFHAYGYGANIEIEVAEEVQALKAEEHVRPRRATHHLTTTKIRSNASTEKKMAERW